MTIVTNTQTTYAAKSLFEDLEDVIYNIAPTETPVMTGAGRVGVKAVLHEWSMDGLAAAVSTNAVLEADNDPSFPSITQVTRVGNYNQISRKLVIVGGTVEAVDKAGRKSEEAYLLSLRSAEIKRDMEMTINSNQGADAGNSTTARKTAGLLAWIKSNTNFYTTDGADPTWTSGVPTAGRTDGGSLRAFTEAMLKDVQSQAWQAGGTGITDLNVGPFNKGVVSGFDGIAVLTQQTNGKAAVIIGAADVYKGDFGTLKVVPNRFQRERDALLLDYNHVSLFFLRKFRTIRLAKTGDAERMMLLVEWGLKVHNEAGIGGVFDLTTA